jgi:hypothetical protein
MNTICIVIERFRYTPFAFLNAKAPAPAIELRTERDQRYGIQKLGRIRPIAMGLYRHATSPAGAARHEYAWVRMGAWDCGTERVRVPGIAGEKRLATSHARER